MSVENPEGIKRADIVVGIPSLNEAASIGQTVEQVSIGLSTYFGDLSTVIVNCDNASPDKTREAFFAAPCKVPRIYASTAPGVVGKGNNLRNLFRVMTDLKAGAGAVVDADLATLSPKWIKNLCEPLLNDYGYVTPIYLRHKYDGAITNNLVYPLSRCLYGRRVRQPVGGDFGFSGEMASYFLENDTWTEAVANYGIDAWMTTLAMYFRKPITQAYLGTPKVHRMVAPDLERGEQFRQIVSTLFNLQVRFAPFWKEVKRSRPTAIFGFGLGETQMPPPVAVDTSELYSAFSEGAKEQGELWRDILAPATLAKLNEVVDSSESDFELPTQLWARILFDFSVTYRDKVFDAQTLMDALSPIYFGKCLSFVYATEGMAMQQAEEYIEEQCLAFEESKPYLLEKWGA